MGAQRHASIYRRGHMRASRIGKVRQTYPREAAKEVSGGAWRTIGLTIPLVDYHGGVRHGHNWAQHLDPRRRGHGRNKQNQDTRGKKKTCSHEDSRWAEPAKRGRSAMGHKQGSNPIVPNEDNERDRGPRLRFPSLPPAIDLAVSYGTGPRFFFPAGALEPPRRWGTASKRYNPQPDDHPDRPSRFPAGTVWGPSRKDSDSQTDPRRRLYVFSPCLSPSPPLCLFLSLHPPLLAIPPSSWPDGYCRCAQDAAEAGLHQ